MVVVVPHFNVFVRSRNRIVHLPELHPSLLMSLVYHFNQTLDFFVINFLILSLEAANSATHGM